MPPVHRPAWLFVLKALAIAVSLGALLLIYLPDLPIVGRVFYPYYFRPTIEQQARQYGLDPLFVAAVIRIESGFKSHARSGVGARGLMQLMPQTAQWAAHQLGHERFRVDELDDPATNIQLGCWYLRYLFGQFHDPAMVLAAYNGGEGNLAYWGSLKGEQLGHAYPETQSYVEAGMRTYSRYQALYPPTSARVVPRGLRVLR